jgi:hypothetical protein
MIRRSGDWFSFIIPPSSGNFFRLPRQIRPNGPISPAVITAKGAVMTAGALVDANFSPVYFFAL